MATKKGDKTFGALVETGVCILDHFAILEPQAPYGTDPNDPTKVKSYYVHLLFPEDQKGLEKYLAEVDNILSLEGWSKADLATTGISNYQEKMKRAEKPESYKYLEGKVYLSAKLPEVTKTNKTSKPNLLKYDRATNSIIKLNDPEEIARLFYRGCRVKASISPSSYKAGGKKGITNRLVSVLFVGDGKPLSTGMGGNEFINNETLAELASYEVSDDDII